MDALDSQGLKTESLVTYALTHAQITNGKLMTQNTHSASTNLRTPSCNIRPAQRARVAAQIKPKNENRSIPSEIELTVKKKTQPITVVGFGAATFIT